jgi:hypothetical protein
VKLLSKSTFGYVLAGLSLTALSICLYIHYSKADIDWNKTKDLVEALKNIFEISAIIFGGIWAYYKFFRGRTYQESLEAKVFGSLASVDGATYIIATAQLKNVGLSDVKINKEGTGLRVSLYNLALGEPEIYTVPDKILSSFKIFKNDESVEPNESIEDQLLIAIPEGVSLAVRLEFYIRSKSGYTWNSATIVENAHEDEPSETKPTPKRKARKPHDGR